MLESEGQDTMHEVTPGGNELIIVTLDEPCPGELGVCRLRCHGRQVVAECIRSIALQRVREPDSPFAAGAELLSFEIKELVSGYVVRQGQGSIVAHQFGGPNDSM